MPVLLVVFPVLELLLVFVEAAAVVVRKRGGVEVGVGVHDVVRVMGEARFLLLLFLLAGVCSGRGEPRCIDMDEDESSVE